MSKEEIQLPRELVIPTKLLFSKEIECEYKQLYMYISYRSSTRGYIWHSNDTLATHLGKNERSIKRALKSLSDAKWIKIENRVKKDSMYHQDMRRVIWIYSDYLVALDRGGYGVARPLAFSTWKKRFISALIDSKNIPLVMYFMPTAQHMGELGIYYDANNKHLYSFNKNQKQYETRTITSEEAADVYRTLYNFYVACHDDIPKQKTKIEEENFIKDFGMFQKYVRSDFIDKRIALVDDKAITVNGFGMIGVLDDFENFRQLETEKAIEIWQYLYVNQNLLED